RTQFPRQRGVRAAYRAFRRQGVPHPDSAQRAPRRGTKLRQGGDRVRHGLHRQPGIPGSGRGNVEKQLMAAKKSRLGRGLDALIKSPPASTSAATSAAPAKVPVTELAVGELRRGRYQPRTRMDAEALEELAASIRSQGVVQPILVRETAAGGYEIVAGERRWRAAQIAGLATVPVVVRQIPDDAAMAVALIENIQREDLNPIEEASGLKRLIDEFGLTHQDVADKVGRSRAAVSNLLRLLNLDPAVREHLEHGRIEMGHARALLALPRERQGPACDMV